MVTHAEGVGFGAQCLMGHTCVETNPTGPAAGVSQSSKPCWVSSRLLTSGLLLKPWYCSPRMGPACSKSCAKFVRQFYDTNTSFIYTGCQSLRLI